MDVELIERLATLSPAGLLLFVVFFQHRQSERRIALLEAEKAALQVKLDAEHQARLQDANANQRALLEVHDRTHKSVDVLERQMEQNEQLAQQQRRRI